MGEGVDGDGEVKGFSTVSEDSVLTKDFGDVIYECGLWRARCLMDTRSLNNLISSFRNRTGLTSIKSEQRMRPLQ